MDSRAGRQNRAALDALIGHIAQDPELYPALKDQAEKLVNGLRGEDDQS